MHEMVNRQNGAALLSVLVCSTLAWLLLGAPTSGINDADIFLVYAWNFLDGHGFVYNIGSELVDMKVLSGRAKNETLAVEASAANFRAMCCWCGIE